MEGNTNRSMKPTFTPPTNLDDFFQAENIKDWPYPMSLEGPLDIKSEAMFIGNQETILDILQEAAPVGFHLLDEMSTRLAALEISIHKYADQILTTEKRGSSSDGILHSPSKALVTQVSESGALLSHRSSRAHRSDDLIDSMLETKRKSLDFFLFPGFVDGEFIELPAQLEAPPILHKVTNVQNFNPGFLTYWKKVFLSEASSAVLQDSFWWVFLDKFNKQGDFDKDKDCLFDRIADSFVAMFTNIHTDLKDKFLSAYPNCLAQAIYLTYKEAFPESRYKFREEFKQYLTNLTYEWVTGLRPMPDLWKTWTDSAYDGSQSSRETETHKKVMEAAALNKQVELSLDMESFYRVLDKLGEEGPSLLSRETTKVTNRQSLRSRGKPQAANLTQNESHQIGPGPEYERVKFNTSGRSPLIAHFLHMRNLRNYKQPGMKVRRTEIVKMPPEGQTYKEFIEGTIKKSEFLNQEYSRICDQTAAEILELEKQRRDTNKETAALRKAFLNSKNPQERRLLMDKIIEYKEMGLKEIPLMEPTSARKDTDDSSDDSDSTI